MSFFIGKDNSSNSVMHITSDISSEAALKGGVVTSTAFHSTLPYLDISIYNCTEVNSWKPGFIGYYITNYAQRCYVPKAARDAIISGKKYFFIASGTSGVLQVLPCIPWTQTYHLLNCIWMPSSSSDPRNYLGNTTPSDSLPAVAIGNIYDFTTVKIVIINNVIDATGYKVPTPINNEILVTSNLLSIRGRDLSSFKYLSSSTINSIDDVATLPATGSTFQVINSNNTSSGMSIENYDYKTFIYKGSHLMFDSTRRSKLKFKSSQSFTTPYGAFRGGPYENVSGRRVTICSSSNLVSGDYFTLEFLDVTAGYQVNWSSIYEYRDNIWIQSPGVIGHHQVGAYWMFAFLGSTTNGGLYLSFYGSFGGGRLYSHSFQFRINIFKD